MGPTLQQLRYFVAVAEHGSISAAAVRLHVAQPSLSSQLKTLERAVGVPLLRRHARGVDLTPAGVAFMTHAKTIIGSADEAVDAARSAAGHQTATLRVGFIVGTQVAVTSRIITTFRERAPDVRLDFTEHTFADPSGGLNAGTVDVAFVMPPIAHSGLAFLEIHRAQRVAVVPSNHRVAGRPAISVTELFDDPWIVAETDDPACRGFWLAAAHRTSPPHVGAATQTIDKFVQLIATGAGVGLAASWAEQAFARPGIAFVPVTDTAPATTALAWPAETPSECTRQFVDVARAVVGDQLAAGSNVGAAGKA